MSFAFLDRARQATRRTPGWGALLISLAVPVLAGLAGALMFAPVISRREAEARSDMPVDGYDPFALSDVAIMLTGMTFLIPLLIWAWLTFWEKRPFKSLGLTGKGLFRLAAGWVFGLNTVIVWVLLLFVFGQSEMTLVAQSVPLGPLLTALLLMPLIWLFQAGTEELLYRGFLLQSVGSRYGLVAGVIISSVLFLFMHSGNGIANPWYFAGVVMLAVFLCIYAIAQNSLWGVIGFHSAWNFGQSHLFGIKATSEDVMANTLFLTIQQTPRLMETEASQTAIAITGLIVGTTLTAIAFFLLLRNNRLTSEEGRQA